MQCAGLLFSWDDAAAALGSRCSGSASAVMFMHRLDAGDTDSSERESEHVGDLPGVKFLGRKFFIRVQQSTFTGLWPLTTALLTWQDNPPE